MSVGSSSLGRRVLVLTTDATQLRQGLTQARAEAIRASAQIRNDARIQLTADLLKLKADFNQAERLARQTAQRVGREDTFVLRANLAQFQSDLRMAEREHAASLRRMQQQSGGGGGALAAFGGAVLGGVGLGTGLALVSQGVGAATALFREGTGVVIGYNAAVQGADALIRGFTRSTFAVAEAQRLANQAVIDGRGGYRETLQALASLTPLANKYGQSLEDVLKTTQLLAALDPVQGFEGAQIALQEALSGNFTSLQRRFELPSSLFQQYQAQGLNNLQVVNKVLADLGITQQLLTEQTGNWNQQLKIAADLVQRFLADAGEPLFDFGLDALKEGVSFLKDPETQRSAREFAEGLRGGLEDLRGFLTDPEVRQQAKAFASDVHDIASGVGALKDALGVVLGPLGQFLGLLAKLEQIPALRDLLLRSVAPGIASLKDLADLRERWEATFGQGAQGPSSPAVAPATESQFDIAARGAKPAPPSGLGSPAVAPESETQFQITADRSIAESWAAQLKQARSDLRAFAADWESEDFNLFDKLAPQVRAAFDDIFGGLDLQQQFERGLGSLDTLTGRMVEDIQNTGKVSQETADLITGALGQEAGRAVLDLANQYAAAAAAADRLKGATDALEAAQSALAAAQRVANRHADESREIIDGMQRDLAALSKEADAVARGYADRLDALRREREAAEAVAEAHRREYQAQIDGLASVQAAQAKAEAVKNLSGEQDATLLDFERRIRAARRGGDERGARALEEERDRFLARSRYAIDLAQLEAKVAQNQADKESQTIQDQADAQAAKDQAAIDAIDQRIRREQEEADQVARDYAARQRAIQDQIDRETERARIIAAADKAAVEAAQDRVDDARTAKDLAEKEARAAADKATAMQSQTTELDKQIKAQRDFIDYLRSLGIDVAKYFNGTGLTGVGLPPVSTGGGGTGAGGGLTPDTLRVPGYAPPRPPVASIPGRAASSGGAGGAALRAGGPVTIQGPFASFPNATIRETVDIERAIEGGATRALERLSAALGDDERAGGNVSWGSN